MISCSLSSVLLPAILRFFSPPHSSCSHQPPNQVTLAEAANNSITRKKDDPFNTMKRRRNGVEADTCAGTLCSNRGCCCCILERYKQEEGRGERAKKKRKRKRRRRRRRRENERLNYDSRTSNIRRKMKVSLRDWCH